MKTIQQIPTLSKGFYVEFISHVKVIFNTNVNEKRKKNKIKQNKTKNSGLADGMVVIIHFLLYCQVF